MSPAAASPASDAAEPYPGERLGLPTTGPGSLASWGSRVSALLIDWGASWLVAILLFGPAVWTATDWRMFAPLLVLFVEKSLLTALSGSSFGQLITRVGVTRVDGGPIGWWRAVVRTLLVCLVIPAMVVGADRRGLDDVLLGTVVVSRR